MGVGIGCEVSVIEGSGDCMVGEVKVDVELAVPASGGSVAGDGLQPASHTTCRINSETVPGTFVMALPDKDITPLPFRTRIRVCSLRDRGCRSPLTPTLP